MTKWWAVEYSYSGRGVIEVEAEDKREAEFIVGEMDFMKLLEDRFDWQAEAFEVKD